MEKSQAGKQSSTGVGKDVLSELVAGSSTRNKGRKQGLPPAPCGG